MSSWLSHVGWFHQLSPRSTPGDFWGIASANQNDMDGAIRAADAALKGVHVHGSISRYWCVGAKLRRNAWIDALRPNNLERFAAKGYSQYGADGVLHKLFADLGTQNKQYVEFGTGRGVETNTRRLREACGWSGLLMDIGYTDKRINLHREFITRENIVQLFRKHRVPTEVDLLSVDINGNEWWVLEALLDQGFRPRVIVAEANLMLPEGVDHVLKYNSSFVWDRATLAQSCYIGSSALAFQRLARHYGYSTVLIYKPDIYLVRDTALADRGLAYQYTNDVPSLLRQANYNLSSTHPARTGLATICKMAYDERGWTSARELLAQRTAKDGKRNGTHLRRPGV